MRTSSRRIAWLALLVPSVGLVFIFLGCFRSPVPRQDVPADGYLFCFWNVENLFDDRDDDRKQAGDKEFDERYAHDGEFRRMKLDHLSKALIELNDGKGPDILAIAEVEGIRAADLLREALNRRLSDPALHYPHLLMKEVSSGRHIAPAIITRLPVDKDKTQLHGRSLRILEGHVQVNGQDLVVIASHWTSQLPQKSKTGGIQHGEEGRAKYGDQIYGTFKGMYLSNPRVDLLVCGDFNDVPEADSITRHLRARGDLDAVRQPKGDPLLLNLFAGKDADDGFGTHYYRGKWEIFDQVVVSPGLVDSSGWSCAVDSVRTVNTLHKPGDRKKRPWRFAEDEDKERGYSDHFPVTVQLKVNAGAP